MRLVVAFWIAVELLGGFTSTGYAQSYPGYWEAKWIWDGGEAKPYHYFLMARKTLTVNEVPARANLRITAADKYLLYVNGEYVGRGPARSDSHYVSYDSYDLTERFRSGSNTLAVLAYHYGTASGYTRGVRAGLWAQLEMTRTNDTTEIVGTDGSWRVRPARGWSTDVKPINISVGVTEVYDARADPPDWMAPGFDDSAWAPANMKLEGVYGTVPWSYLEARRTPTLREVEIFPRQIEGRGEVEDQPVTDVAVPERLASEPHFSLKHARVESEADMLAADGRSGRVVGGIADASTGLKAGKRALYMVFDFGRPIFGFPRLRMNAAAGVVVDFAYGARILGDADVHAWLDDTDATGELRRELEQRRGRPDLLYMPGMRYGDRYIAREGHQTWQSFEPKLFRYLLVIWRGADAPVEVDAVSAIAYEYPAHQRGAFECSDQLLSRLWQACIDTTYLHMEDALVCDAIRERRVWTGDGGHGLLGIYAGYGDIALSDWYFKLVARGQLGDGMLRMFYPGHDIFERWRPGSGAGRSAVLPSGGDPLNIPQFAFFYVYLLGEYQRYFGKAKLVRELYPALVRLAEWCERHSDDTGLLYGLPNWNFVDWVKTDMRGANFETNVLYYRMLIELEAMAAGAGEPADAAKWHALAIGVRASLQRLHWNAERGLFADGYFDGRQSATYTETANGMALLFEVAEANQRRKLVEHLSRRDAALLPSSPLYYNYTIEGLMKVGATDAALALMRERYRPMVEASDVPTMWENWDVNRRSDQSGRQKVTLTSSPVHSGSVGPAWVLSKYVLGVRADEPGLAGLRIEPHPGDLSFARGVVPTGAGDIGVDWRREDRTFRLEVSLPPGLPAKLVIPWKPGRPARLTHNDRVMQIASSTKWTGNVVVSEDQIVIEVRGGKHLIEIVSED